MDYIFAAIFATASAAFLHHDTVKSQEINFHVSVKKDGQPQRPMITFRGIPFDQICNLCLNYACHYHIQNHQTLSLCDSHEKAYTKFKSLNQNYDGKEVYEKYIMYIGVDDDSQGNE
jgi:hypothetical protein